MNVTFSGLLHVIADMPHAVAVYDSEDLNIAVANEKMLEIWSRKDDLTGRRFGEVFPEHVKQGFDALLRNVWKTGHTYDALETRADITIDGIPTTKFFDVIDGKKICTRYFILAGLLYIYFLGFLTVLLKVHIYVYNNYKTFLALSIFTA